MTKTIDLTPRGLTNPKGIKRTREAMDELSNATSNLCHALMECMTSDRSMESSLRTLGCDPDEIAYVINFVDRRKAATEEFLRSLTGAPPQKHL